MDNFDAARKISAQHEVLFCSCWPGVLLASEPGTGFLEVVVPDATDGTVGTSSCASQSVSFESTIIQAFSQRPDISWEMLAHSLQ